jgi:dethiobiotin synthetase
VTDNGLVVAGIGTGVGKTLVASILVEVFAADYWKPVQAGNLDFSDTDFLRKHISNNESFFFPEAYRLTMPMSPHAAARMDGVAISFQKLTIPKHENPIVIELAGGLMVPLNDTHLNIDLLSLWNLPVVLVSHNYLGSINHTLLSVEALRSRSINLAGVIFNGKSVPSTEEIILKHAQVKCLARIHWEKKIVPATVRKYAAALKGKLKII